MVARIYDPTVGEVLIDSHNVKDYNLAALRNCIGVVPQNSTLFSGTIKDNILWGKKDATDNEINEALKEAQAYDFVYSFKDGLNTKISQDGTSISGGQRQRLAIARALIKKPKILILDDATSAVDVKTESLIKKAIFTKLKGTTIIIIAQRISSVADADKIIVLDKTIEAVGKHSKLLETSKIYREIYESQKKVI